MKLVLRITSVFDENVKMQIRNIPTLFLVHALQGFSFIPAVHFVQQATALAIN